jgi:hypothetical protein
MLVDEMDTRNDDIASSLTATVQRWAHGSQHHVLRQCSALTDHRPQLMTIMGCAHLCGFKRGGRRAARSGYGCWLA